MFFLTFYKKGLKVLTRGISNYGFDINFTPGEKYEQTKIKTAQKFFTRGISILRYMYRNFG